MRQHLRRCKNGVCRQRIREGRGCPSPGQQGSRMIHPVILSGGSGTRLWPMSRTLYPKQLLALFGDHSLLQQTVLRVSDTKEFGPPLVVANEEHRFIIAEQLRAIGSAPQALLLEPFGRNTAPAAAVAALRLAADDPEALMLLMTRIMSSPTEMRFLSAMDRAIMAARQGMLV